ncbi:MAG: manganese-dependent inorganic pyrophosphatase [Thermoleophilaceae bacterium]|nr:manganese-dependent inorganic pyrophosphatase [Thermoleophilaceae bacterium]
MSFLPSPPRSPKERLIYVTGHRNPDADSVASAIGYAELKRRLDPLSIYVPVRLGEVNAQTRWLLERSEAPEPELLSHVSLRVCDVMYESFQVARQREPVRAVGLAMAGQGLDLMPVVGDDGSLVGVMTERALARRYIRESREVSALVAPTAVSAVVGVLDGVFVSGEEKDIAGRVWAQSMDVASPTSMAPGDVVVVGDRPEAQRLAIEHGVALLVTSNGTTPSQEILALARDAGTAVVSSPLDTYVSARMITLAAPCSALMDRDPLTVGSEDLLADIADQVKTVHYGGAIVVDGGGHPIGLVTRSDLVSPTPRRVLLVDHAEQAQSVPGVGEAEIVEILDHHHVGSIETTVPVTATFDPVGSTATLVIERFRQSGMEPSRPTATMLLGALLSDTVILNSPTTTERDRSVATYLEQVLALDPVEFGSAMFEDTSDVSELPPEDIVSRDAKEYEVAGGQTICIAQVETVGKALLERKDELVAALDETRERKGYSLFALMVTDIVTKGTELLVSGDRATLERAFDQPLTDGVVSLPGIMSRKKQVAPKLLAAARR